MTRAELGDTVRVHFRGEFEDGSKFDSVYEGSPLEFIIGQHRVSEQIENAILGLEVGDNKRIQLMSAFGEYDDQLQFSILRTQLPRDLKPEVGLILEYMLNDGAVVNGRITEMDDYFITLDTNHPMAGKSFSIELELVNICRGEMC